ncbi:hypothetical protein DSL72_008583 [Monilinia vaccinii-corymbosi]|uniref:Uncharacterized protein n=1 Tax=Monilinia vaccinii-corymbosi TaxID=61207 RepID=A0A8A3PRJ0_9HELO|nr:hypothetical protein DSL72_008583 [Monilinia vaccinii-corymbosi]
MAFYDPSSDHEDGFPIILEPDDDSSFEMRIGDTRTNHDAMKEVHHVKEVRGVEEVDTNTNVMVPKHPIDAMQGAFAESMEEASDTTRTVPKLGDAAARRQILLEQGLDEDTHPPRWQKKPGQKYHELWRLMAQISFGIYLLLEGIARDEEQVMSILQGHVNEVDGFLEMALEDFDLAQSDIEERSKHLKLPLENIAIFDAMLEDGAFRSQIVSGNARIEHVITRTAAAMKETLLDAQQGMDACKEFTIYLAGQKDETWRQQVPNMERAFDAMCGNVEVWHKAYISLQTKGQHLGVALDQLGSIVAEMDRRAGQISRPSRINISAPVQAQAAQPKSRSLRASMIKELPSEPNLITPAASATLPAFALVQDRGRTPEPESEPALEPERETESEPLYILKPITYSPTFAPTTHSSIFASKTYSSAVAPTINTPTLAPTTYSPLLLPTTYTPNPSPIASSKPSPSNSPQTSPTKDAPPGPLPQPVTEGKRRPSLRKRFSLKRKESLSETSRPPPKLISAPRIISVAESVVDAHSKPDQAIRPRDHSQRNGVEPLDLSADRKERSRERFREDHRREESGREPKREEPRTRGDKSTGHNQEEHKGSGPLSISRHPELATNSLASHGIDSAYCSESDPPIAIRSIQEAFPSPPLNSPSSVTTLPVLASRDYNTSTPILTIPSPSSDKQFFRPVHASRHSPLQRPWTAAPAHPEREPSLLGKSKAPSEARMSDMSDLTTVTLEDGKKSKKKKSAFGWLKKAFSLSEEERLEYEERRRNQNPDPYLEQSPPRQFLDGKRLTHPQREQMYQEGERI